MLLLFTAFVVVAVDCCGAAVVGGVVTIVGGGALLLLLLVAVAVSLSKVNILTICSLIHSNYTSSCKAVATRSHRSKSIIFAKWMSLGRSWANYQVTQSRTKADEREGEKQHGIMLV